MLNLLTHISLIAPPAYARVDIGQYFGQESFLGGVGISTRIPFLSTIANPIIKNTYVVAGLIILALVLFGGLTIITNAGNPDKISQGKQVIAASIIGFLLIFASYWIIQIIEVLTGLDILNPVI